MFSRVFEEGNIKRKLSSGVLGMILPYVDSPGLLQGMSTLCLYIVFLQVLLWMVIPYIIMCNLSSRMASLYSAYPQVWFGMTVTCVVCP